MSTDVHISSDPLLLPDDPALLKQMILELLNTQQRSQRTIDGLQQQLEQLLKRLYGPRGEKFDPQAYALFPELKTLLDQPAPPSTVPAVEAASTPKKASTGRRQLPSSLRREQHRYELPEDQRQCPQCHVTCEAFSEEITEQLDYIPANLFVHEHIRCKYACPQCRAHVVTAPKPAQPIDKGLPAAGLIAHIAVCKYSDHLPLHRQEQIFARHGLEIARSTTCDWMAAAAELLKPLYDEMVQEILQSRVLHTDDTRVSMQDKATAGKTTSTRFWTYVGDDEHPLTVFDFTLSRERDGPAAFLKRYSGAIQADGYSAYDGIALSGNLGTDGPPAKRSEGHYRFLCPHCQEMLATVNPRNNLAHCFGCKKNLNNIDLLMNLGYDFKSAVSILLRMYEQHRSRLPQATSHTASN